MHALLLRDLLQDRAEADAWDLASAWYELTRTEMEPWYRTTLDYDRHRLDEAEAIIEGKDFSSPDEAWNMSRAIEAHAFEEPDLLRANLEIGMCLRRADEVIGDPAIKALLDDHRQPRGDGPPPLGPSRAELLAALT
jgi:hypothetical protein